MQNISRYLLTVTTAAIIVGILRSFFRGKCGTVSILKILTGAFLTVSVLTPWVNWQFSDLFVSVDNVRQEAVDVALTSKERALNEYRAIIKEQSEAYILDKAAFLGVNIAVNITLKEENPPVPESVVICGAVSPYEKSELRRYIASQLGIPEEMQIWK